MREPGPANLLAVARRALVPSEHDEQVALFAALERFRAVRPELALAFAIPNGGHRAKATAGRLKAEGVRAGVPDVFLPVRRGDWAGLFIELKRRDGGTVRRGQREWHQALREAGYKCEVCAGAEHALRVMLDYVSHRG